jgi:hypothetical protein
MGILRRPHAIRSEELSFFDEGDQPTRVRTRPARPRRPATASRPAGAPPDRQTARTRQAVGLAILLVVFIVLAFGIKGCVDSRNDNALKDYNRNVTAVIKDSDGSVGRPFFQLMSNASRRGSDLGVQVNQLRLAADEDVKRAKNFDVPGDMKPAQRNLELALNLRAEALRRIAGDIPVALGRGPASQQAIDRVAGQMQSFLASDVVYSQRVAPGIKDALDGNGVKGQQISGSQFMRDISWLSPDTVAGALGRQAAAGTGTSGTPAPGLHGHGLVSTSVGATTLQPEAPGVVNRVPASANVAFTVKFANQGDNDESNVKVSLRVVGGGRNISETKTISQTKSKTESTVTIPLGQAPPVGQATTVTVQVARVPGEKNIENNRSSYTVIFTQ